MYMNCLEAILFGTIVKKLRIIMLTYYDGNEIYDDNDDIIGMLNNLRGLECLEHNELKDHKSSHCNPMKKFESFFMERKRNCILIV